MASLQEIFDNLGITPEKAFRGGPSTIGQFNRSRRPQGGMVPFQAAPVVGGPGGPVSGGNGGLRFGALDFSDGVEFGKYQEPEPDGFWGSTVGKGIAKAFDVVDTPRAIAVAAGKALGEGLNPNRDTSWDEFYSDASRNIGFQEVLDDTVDMPGGWQRSALGLAGDVAFDPLTYVGVGVARRAVKPLAVGAGMGRNVAKEAGERAVRQAAVSGGRETMAKALTERAFQVGLHNDAAVRKLVANSARKGRGAITTGALKAAGVSDDVVEQLGIPQLRKTFMGKAIPGSRVWAEAAEAGKGALKSAIGDTGAASLYRSLRVTNAGGRSMLLDIARRTTDSKKGFTAVAAGVAAQRGKIEGYAWADLWSQKARQTMGDDLRKLAPEDAALITHGIEDAVADTAGGKVSQFFDELADDLIARGVTITKRPNYVPHILTAEARRSDSDEIRKFVNKVDDQAFFEKARSLEPGDTFMGVPLKTATIKEFNDISMSAVGYKVFKDDIRDLMADYMTQGGQTVIRKNIDDTLREFGIAVEQKAKHLLDDTQGKALKEADKAAEKARKQQEVLLSSGVAVRLDEAGAMDAALKRERNTLKARIRDLNVKIGNTYRAQFELQAKLAKLETQIGPLEAHLKTLRKVAGSKRSEARKAAMAEVRRAERQLALKVADVQKLRSQLDSFLQKRSGGARGSAVKSTLDRQMAEVKAASERVAAVQADADMLLQSNKVLGEGSLPSEIVLRLEQATADSINREISKHPQRAVEMVWANIDDQRQLEWLLKAKADLDKAFEKTTKVKKMNSGSSDYQAVRTYVSDVRHMLESPDYAQAFGAEIKVVRNLEAAAAVYDMKALKAGRKAGNFEDAARAMRDPGFGNKVLYDLEVGMRKLTADGQFAIPNWVAEAYDAAGIISDPKFWPQAAEFMSKFENVWKGWAVGRPGFLVRNAYGAAFNVFLEGGPRAFESIVQFKKFFKMYRADPTNYMEQATARWGAETAQMMDESMKVVNATGGGLAPAEFHTGFMHKANWKPWSADFGYIKGIRAANEVVEGVVRGGHAFDVMKRGGTTGSAVDVIEKYHFNYRDLSKMDRKIKRVIPFWTFFANNVALQAHVFTHNLDDLNRTYMNLHRNMGYGDDPEQGQPEWMARNLGLPLSVNPQGDSQYLNIGLPSIDFMRDAQAYTDNPKQALSMLAPWYQVPASAVAGENFYTGRPLTGVRDAGIYGMIPGVGERTGSGGEAISPLQLDILNGLLPGASNLNRATGGGDAPDWQKIFGMTTGLGVQELTPEMREADAYAKILEERAAQKRRNQLQGM